MPGHGAYCMARDCWYEYKELLHLMTEPEKGEENREENSSKVLKKFVLTKAELDQRLKEAEKIIRRKF